MMTRWWNLLTVVVGAALGGSLLASPAMAVGLDEARRRGGGIGSFLAGLCCLIIVVLVGGGVFLGIFLSRRRKG
jgi:ABC-type phosphate transport system permease subunit